MLNSKGNFSLNRENGNILQVNTQISYESHERKNVISKKKKHKKQPTNYHHHQKNTEEMIFSIITDVTLSPGATLFLLHSEATTPESSDTNFFP